MKKTFQTEVSQLLDLVIHSLYSKKEVFLRELISNASDAIDRSRFEGLTDAAQASDSDYTVQIIPNAEANTLTITDNGVGMTAEEVEKNLGTVASSGTKRFLQAVKDKANAPELIGQFGVGFYAAFMVADKVEVLTRRRGAQAVQWSSDGLGTYEIEPADDDTAYGTTIRLHLREDAKEFTDDWRLREIIRTYSDYIAYPIMLCPDPSVKPEPKKDADGKDLPPEERVPEQVNSMKAIWKRPKSEVKPEESNAFYKHIAHDSEDPLSTIHISAEGATEFQALLFIPRTAPYDLYFANAKQGLQLYVRNVFIGDDIRELLPRYLCFMRGVVESSDLPLNVSREMLQDNQIIRRIRKTLVSKILSELEDMLKNRPDDFKLFTTQYGRLLKDGCYSDWENSDKLRELVMFPSTKSEDAATLTSLQDYVSRMPEAQKQIYYLSADTFDAARNSPVLEAFRKHGFEVLFFIDPIDEYFAERVREYDGKALRAADRGDLDLDDPEGKNKDKDGKPAETDEDRKFAPLSEYLKKRFETDVKDVRLSKRLTDSACCFVADEYGVSAHMERVMRAFNQPVPKTKRILELNPASPLIEKMLGMVPDASVADDLGDLADVLFGQAQLAEGTPLSDPARFNLLVSRFAAR